MADNLRNNGYGYPDPTAYEAIINVSKEEERFQTALHTFFNICRLAGFQLKGNIVLKDEKTKKEWKRDIW